MESNNVRKLFLVDQFDRVYKELQRPLQAVAKTKSSINLSRTLQDNHLTEDEKVRRYIDELHRYLHIREARPQYQQQQQQQPKVRRKPPPSITTERPPTVTSPPPPSLSPRRLRPTSRRQLHSTSTATRSVNDDDDDDEVFKFTSQPKQKKKKPKIDGDDWSKYQQTAR